MLESARQISVVVYLRASAPFPARERQEEVVERVERLAEEGRIDGVDVRRWDDRIVVRDDDDEGGPVETFEAFKERAAEIDHSIEPFFQEHERAGTREIVFPIVCIVVYVGEELRRVFPCRDEEGIYSVWDCLTTLESGGELADLAD